MPQRMPPLPEGLEILFEDAAVLAVAKPAGLHVFPLRRGERQSVWSRLKKMRPGLTKVGDPAAPAFAHRLDLGTSGILLAAKTDRAYRRLREAFEKGQVEKEYLALVEGVLSDPVEVDLPIGSRYRRSAKVQVQLPGRHLRGVRPARTSAEPLAGSDDLTLCRVRIQTGVRHQIRAHLRYLGHPVAGDLDYGASRIVLNLEDRFFLHAWRVSLSHPQTGSALEICCPLPLDLLQILQGLGMNPPGGP